MAPPVRKPTTSLKSSKGRQQPEASSSRPIKSLQLPSSRLNIHKQANPWSSGSTKYKTNFSSVYAAGGIPCRINHGGVKHALCWDEPPETLPYDPLLTQCCEGFAETQHPYVFISRSAFKELLAAEGAAAKTSPLLPSLILSIRKSLMSKHEDEVIVALEALRLLSDLLKTNVNSHVPKLLSQLHNKISKPKLSKHVREALHALERNGGSAVTAMIKRKIPTF